MRLYYLSTWINPISHTYQTFLSSTFLWPSFFLSPGSMNFAVRNILWKKRSKIHFKIYGTAKTNIFSLCLVNYNKYRVRRRKYTNTGDLIYKKETLTHTFTSCLFQFFRKMTNIFKNKSKTVLEKQRRVLSANENKQWRNLHRNRGKEKGV